MKDSPDTTIRSAFRYLSMGWGLDTVSTEVLVDLLSSVEKHLNERLKAQEFVKGDIVINRHTKEEREVLTVDKLPYNTYITIWPADSKRAGGEGLQFNRIESNPNKTEKLALNAIRAQYFKKGS